MIRCLIALACCLLATLTFSYDEEAHEGFFPSTPEQIASLTRISHTRWANLANLSAIFCISLVANMMNILASSRTAKSVATPCPPLHPRV